MYKCIYVYMLYLYTCIYIYIYIYIYICHDYIILYTIIIYFVCVQSILIPVSQIS